MKPIVKSQNTPILDIENIRDMLARRSDVRAFKKSYLVNIFRIKDVNTPSFWDKKHRYETQNLLNSYIYKDKIDIVTKWIGNNSGNILDIGFGSFEIENILSKGNQQLFGIDISSASVRKAVNKFGNTFKLGTIFNIPFPQGYFDYVLALDILEHISSDKVFDAYNEIFRVLKHNGILIVSVPLNEDLDKMVQNHKNLNGHLRIYTQEILKFELHIAGFKIDKEKCLYAFRNGYNIKKFFVKVLSVFGWKPNLLIVLAQKK